MSDREAFEKWAATEFDNIRRDGSSYESMMVAGAYIGWQAAQAQAGEVVGVINYADYQAMDGTPMRMAVDETSPKSIQGLPVGTKLYTAPPAAKVNQQAIDIIQDCIAMGYLVETVDSSPTHRGLVKRAHKVIESSGETPQSVIAVQQAAAAVNQQLLDDSKWDELVIAAAVYANLFLEISETDVIEFGRKLRELIAAAQEQSK